MKINKTKLLFIATLFFLAIPLILTTGNAQAAVFVHTDGATLNANGGWDLPTDLGSCYTGTISGGATQDTTLSPAQCRDTRDASVAAETSKTACTNAGFKWQYGCADGTAGCCWPNWKFTGTYTGNDQCLRCHNTAYMDGHSPDPAPQAAKESYLLTGHRNMLRKVTTATGTITLGGVNWATSNSTVPGFPTVSGAAPYTLPANTAYVWGGWYGNLKKAQILRQPAIPDAPRTVSPGGSYTCSECHTTGWNVTTSSPAQTIQPPAGLINTSGATWIYEGIQCSRCHDHTPLAGNVTNGDYTASHNNGAAEYQEATELCFQCHTQELPADENVSDVSVGSHGSYAAAFNGHYRTNQFLNSPHAKFTGTEGQVGDASNYASHFKDFTTGNNDGCVQCHDVHVSSVDPDVLDPTNTLSNIKATGTCSVSCHANKLDGIKHPVGPGTPLDGDLTSNKGRMMACVTCHMGPGTNHLFRINTDPNYTPFPTAAQFAAGQTTAITYDDGGYAAVGMSLDLACGQCHGGSAGQAAAKAGVPYMDLNQLAAYAQGMHGQATSAPAAASTGLAINDYTVTFVDASTNSDYAAATDMKVTVNWGDGNVSTGVGGDAFTHTYTAAATFYVQHTVMLNNKFNTETIKVVVPSAVLGGGTVGVQVNDYNAAGLADVSLYLKQNGLTKKLGATDSTGAFTFQDVPSGTYDLIAYKYGVLLSSADCATGTVTVDAATPAPTCTFGQTQTQFSLTVNAAAGHVITVKQAGVTKGIQKVTGTSVVFGNLPAGNYTVDGYMYQSTCDQAAVTLGPDATITLTCP